jgi:hypothetical protein
MLGGLVNDGEKIVRYRCRFVIYFRATISSGNKYTVAAFVFGRVRRSFDDVSQRSERGGAGNSPQKSQRDKRHKKKAKVVKVRLSHLFLW